MSGIRRWTAAVVVTLLAGVLTPAGTGVAAEAQTPPPEPASEIEVTYLTDGDGNPLSATAAITSQGEVLVSAAGPFQWATFLPLPVIWKDGEVTRVDDEDEQWTATGISDRGEVVGLAGPRDGPPGTGYSWHSWLDGETTALPTGDAPVSYPVAVNDRGTIAGVFSFEYPPDPQNPPDPEIDRPGPKLVVWHDGEIVTAPLDASSLAPSLFDVHINNRDQVAMNVISDDNTRAAIWDVDTGEITELGTLGGDTSRATAINDRGMVIGNSTDADGDEHAFLWHNGEMTDLGTLGGDTSEAVDLNEWGQVIGQSTDADGAEHAFLWHNGEITQISLGGTSGSTASAINNWGQVVGRAPTPGGPMQAFLWQNGQIVNLGELADPDEVSRVSDINDRGQIVGSTGLWALDWGGQGWRESAVMWTVSPLWGYPDDL